MAGTNMLGIGTVDPILQMRMELIYSTSMEMETIGI